MTHAKMPGGGAGHFDTTGDNGQAISPEYTEIPYSVRWPAHVAERFSRWNRAIDLALAGEQQPHWLAETAAASIWAEWVVSP
jgi:hypothetical protein